MRSICSSKEKQPSPMGTTNNTVFNSYHQKKYDTNHHSSKVFPTPTNSHKFFTLPGITTHAPHIFHVQLHDDPHIVSPHPHETALHTPPCGTCAKLLSNHAIFPPHFKTIVPCHLGSYRAWPLKTYSAPSLC